MLLIRLLRVPKAPLIACKPVAIVLLMALPILSTAATIAAQSIPNCALAGLRVTRDTMTNSTTTITRYSHNSCNNRHFGFIRVLLLKQRCRVLAELARHIGLALTDCVGIRQDG